MKCKSCQTNMSELGYDCTYGTYEGLCPECLASEYAMRTQGDCGECASYAACECVGPHDSRCSESDASVDYRAGGDELREAFFVYRTKQKGIGIKVSVADFAAGWNAAEAAEER